jgi:hypothetical protein
MVALVGELRRKAALCRQAVSISTSGSGRTDHILLELADQLEREAALRERELHDGAYREQGPASEKTQEDRGKENPAARGP